MIVICRLVVVDNFFSFHFFFSTCQCQNAALDELFGNPKEVHIFQLALSISAISWQFSSSSTRFFLCSYSCCLCFFSSVRRSTRQRRFCFKVSRKTHILKMIGGFCRNVSFDCCYMYLMMSMSCLGVVVGARESRIVLTNPLAINPFLSLIRKKKII